MNRFLVGIVTFVILFASSCKEDDAFSKQVDFDRTALLEHYAQEIIPMQYEKLHANVVAMDEAWTEFKGNPSEANLSLLQNDFIESYKSWQGCSVYEIGPAEQILFRSNMNTFPTDTFKIGTNIRSANYTLSAASNLDAKGLPALDYLFFRDSNPNTVIEFLNQASTTVYVDAILNDIKMNVNFVYNTWASSSYRTQFIAKNGVDVGSSLGQLVNQFNFDLELIKTAKLGIPLGKKTMGVPLPKMVEAYYSGYSKELILLNLKNLINVFAGDVEGQTNGIGLDDYLKASSAKTNGQDLDVKIFEQMQSAYVANEALPSILSEAIINQNSLVESAYTEVQRCIIYTKTDMPSALGIMITYQDNDGD